MDQVSAFRTGSHRIAVSLCMLIFLLAAPPAQAQISDTTRTPADTLHAASGPPLGFPQPVPGFVVGDTILAVVPALDVPDLLSGVSGTFTYDFGAFGWPDGWSPFGFDPNRMALTWDGLPFDDPVTGRPRYDLLPMALLEPLHVAPAQRDAPVGVQARTRAFAVPQPLTELRYQTGGGSIQSISGLHRQRRRWTVRDRPTDFSALFAYGGYAADNTYPGSRLRRGRQLLGRLRLTQPRWSMQLQNLHNRRQLGAHGGVIPRGPFETIYSLIEPQVEHPAARRQTIRNDLAATAWWRWAENSTPLHLRTDWTAQTFRYRNPGVDTLMAETDRYGASLEQRLHLGPHHLTATLHGWTDRLDRSNALPDSLGLTHSRLFASLRDSLRLSGWTATLAAHVQAEDEDTVLGGHLHLARDFGPLRLTAEAWHAGMPTSWIDRYGWGPFVQPLDTSSASRVTQARLGVALTTRWFDVNLSGFASRQTDPLDLFVTQDDVIAARMVNERIDRAGATFDLGLRRTAERGLYLTAQATALQLLDADASPERQRLAASLPDAWGQARLGARYLLFRGDLDLDVTLRARGWTDFRSRTLHPPTGLLALPPADARIFGPSGTVDLVVQGGIRTATLFLVYENLLSGTSLQVGTLLVPTYPLPQQRLRFGVYWPILN
jgi:hypothetical protein